MTLTAEDYREMYERERDLREQESRARMDQFRERERQRKVEYEERMRTTEDWDDAWVKAIALLEREVAMECGSEVVDDFFRDELAFTEKAHALYEEQLKAIKPQIRQIREEAERQIAELEQSVLNAVADTLVAENIGAEGESVIQALREDNPQILVEW